MSSHDESAAAATASFARFFATCPGHIEPLLYREISEILAEAGTEAGTADGAGTETGAADGAGTEAPVRQTRGGVYFAGELSAAYRVCLWSSLAGRVLGEIAVGAIADRDDLYRLASEPAYERYFEATNTIAVFGHVSHRAFRDTRLPLLVVKDAVADRFRARSGTRPSVDTEEPEVRLYLHLTDRQARLYIDLSGESLHRRGYRRISTAAPLRENTAAAVLRRLGWTEALRRWRRRGGECPFLADPMCGSGTIPIEAARQAVDTAPGLGRERFGFETLSNYAAPTWQALRDEARRRSEEGRRQWLAAGGRIWASDEDEDAVSAVRENASAAGVEDLLTIDTADFLRLPRGAVLGALNKGYTPEAGLPYFIAMNPPYGERLGGNDAEKLYEGIGRRLSEQFRGVRAGVLAGSKEQARTLGLRATGVHPLYNGNLAVVLAVIDIDDTNRFRPVSRADGWGRTDETRGPAMLENRLRKNRRALRRFLEEERVRCYRIYDADIPQYAATVDVLTDRDDHRWAVVQEYEPPATVEREAARRRFGELAETVRRFLELEESRVITRRRHRQREGQQYERAARPRSRTILVEEDGLLFELNLTDYLDFGLFLDHRLVRRWIRRRAAAGRFLNLFAYTCSATVHAAAGGAERTVSVDTSRSYLDWGRRNLRLNGFTGPRHELLRAGATAYLDSADDTFDLIFLDPPSFSNSKSREGDFDVQRDHPRLLRSALSRLSASGEIVFSSNLRSFVLSEEIARIAEVSDISEKTLPPDFARRKKQRHVYVLRKGSEVYSSCMTPSD
ncbi:MAG: bifunctional 23S rRNA (guanine(2069)-N(7))-methyltransferase RlmK/23S rRNA (guanine(2445)-N(2))-methyltransferase RlmL, partial [Spirochaetaceae bacterium]